MDQAVGVSLPGGTLAPIGEVRRWLLGGFLCGLTLLGLVLAVALAARPDTSAGAGTGLLDPHQGLADALSISARNSLVLGLTFGVSWVAARLAAPAGQRRGWLATSSRLRWAPLALAVAIAAVSFAFQVLRLGHGLADISAYAHISRAHLLVLLLPHALLELTAMFLPVGLLLSTCRARQHADRLQTWTVQALVLALPLLLGAALIETFVSPLLVIAAAH